METRLSSVVMSTLLLAPLSQGKPIEWKPAPLKVFPCWVTTPLSQGKPIEWKPATAIAQRVKAMPTPLSQGKPIEWKLSFISHII